MQPLNTLATRLLVRNFLILLAFTVVFAALGSIAFFVVIRKPEVMAELVVPLESVSTDGLGRIEQTQPLILVQYAGQLLMSRTVTQHAANQFPGCDASEIEEGITIEILPNSSLITLRLAWRDTHQAVPLMRAILEKASQLSVSAREDQISRLKEALTGEEKEAQARVAAVQAKIVAHQTATDLVVAKQKQSALSHLLSDYQIRISQLRINENSLKNILESPANDANVDASGIMELDQSSQNAPLATARRVYSEAVSKTASLRSRYGVNHPQVLAAQAEVKRGAETVSQLLQDQRNRLLVQSRTSNESIALLTDEMKQALANWSPLSAEDDLELADLLATQDLEVRAYHAISNRLLELRISGESLTPSFDIVTAPFLSNRIGLKPLVATVLLFALFGASAGVTFVARSFLRRAEPEHEFEPQPPAGEEALQTTSAQ